MSLDLVSLLKEQFGCCVKILKMISDQDKIKAIQHIKSFLTEFDIDLKESSGGCKEEYFEDSVKKKDEEEDIKPDVSKLINSDNASVKIKPIGKRKRENSNHEESDLDLHILAKHKSGLRADERDSQIKELVVASSLEDKISLDELAVPFCGGNPANVRSITGFKIPMRSTTPVNDDVVSLDIIDSYNNNKNVLGCNNRLKCPLCTTTFFGEMSEMMVHLKACHGNGNVKRHNSLSGQEKVKRLKSMAPQEQVRHLGDTLAPNLKYPLLCIECGKWFHDSKSIVKHTRIQHQIYQCRECVVRKQLSGCYRMAAHTMKNHSKEPSVFCQCGRNFSLKKGLTKHQNSCSFFNPQ